MIGLGAGVKIALARNGTPWVASAVFREGCTVVHLEHATTNQVAALHIKTEVTSINMINFYCKVQEGAKEDMKRALGELNLSLNQLNGDGVIIGADANARSSLWHSAGTNERS